MATSFSRKDAPFRAFDTTPEEEVAAEALVRRFLFSYDFEAPQPEAPRFSDEEIDSQMEETDPEPIPPPPLFTEEDLEAAREEARVLGHAQGLKDAEESALHFQAQALARVAEEIGEIRARQETANGETHRLAAGLAMAVTKKLLPRLAAEHGAAEIEALVEDCVPHILNEPRLILRVSPLHTEAIRRRIEMLARDRGFDGSVVVMEDEAIGPADCRLEWNNGGAERDVASLFQRIEDIVARNSRTASGGGDLDPDPAVPV